MSNYIQSKLVNCATILFVELESGEIYYESSPLHSCDEILKEAERITRDVIEAA